jgi:hypothetical protein
LKYAEPGVLFPTEALRCHVISAFGFTINQFVGGNIPLENSSVTDPVMQKPGLRICFHKSIIAWILISNIVRQCCEYIDGVIAYGSPN